MQSTKRPLFWIVIHLLAIACVVTSLLTGLRIAILSKPYLLHLNALLPQGELHSVHIVAACVFTAVALAYVLYLFSSRRKDQAAAKKHASAYHLWLTRFVYFLTVCTLLSGWMLFFDPPQADRLVTLHFAAAIGFFIYLLLHGVGYWVEYGMPALERVTLPAVTQLKYQALLLSAGVVAFLAVFFFSFGQRQLPVIVKHIPLDVLIEIDGVANEAVWEQVPSTAIVTHGGANFVDGTSRVEVRGVENGEELFLHIRWDDPTASLKHLPLVKTAQGWQVRQNGFHHFNEVELYEDKFAIMLSPNCEFGAAGTMHLGTKPLADKPANWHGKGYHYATDGQIRDLWHWKAVRTNAMVLMDDNHIGEPDVKRAGSRRYTGGYLADGKESGAYVMNWQWYKPGVIEPKRLPKESTLLAPFQTVSRHDELDWVIPWFDYEPYTVAADRYPVGTIMPSVMYRSNRFEGDRADVRAFARWHDGQWSLELVRKLNTGSAYDVAIQDGVCFWVSAFDHAQVAHTRHTQALQFSFEAQ